LSKTFGTDIEEKHDRQGGLLMKAKVGLITTMSLDKTWPEAVVRKVEDDHRRARKALEEMGFRVVVPNQGLSRSKEEMVRDGNALRAEGVETTVVYVGTWTYSSVTVELADVVRTPVLIWTNSGPGNLGIVGGAIARGALDEVGAFATLVHGDFDDRATLERIRIWCVGTAGATRLRGMTFGIGGSRCMGMYTAHVDPSELKIRFGVDIDGWDEIAVIERSKKMPEQQVTEFYRWMEKTFGGIEAKEEAVKAQIRMYLALRELIEERSYDAVAVKCLPHLPPVHTTFCLAHALLNDTSDAFGPKESFVCGCEADVNGTLTMQMLHNVSGQTTMFADFLCYEEEKNLVTLCNCGSQPTEMAPSKKDVRWVHEGLQEFQWVIGGCCPQYVAKPGRVTMARLGRIAGEYVMLILSGEAKQYPREKLAEINPQQPQAFVELSCTPEEFIAELRCNHIHVVYGDYVRELEVLCRVLGIRAIVPGAGSAARV
jgi:L-fucose isomerase